MGTWNVSAKSESRADRSDRKTYGESFPRTNDTLSASYVSVR